MTIYDDTLSETIDSLGSPSEAVTFENTLTEVVVSLGLPNESQLAKNTISKSIIFNSTLPLVYPVVVVNNSISITGLFTLKHIAFLVSSIISSSQVTNSLITKDSCIELLNILDSSYIEFNNSISDQVTFTPSFSLIAHKIELISNVIALSDSLVPKIYLLNVINEVIALLGDTHRSAVDTISEVIEINNTISELYRVYNSILNSIDFTSNFSTSRINMLVISDSLISDDTFFNRLSARSAISNNIAISIPTPSGGDTYLGYTFAPENRSVTTYTNYNFNNCTKFLGNYLFSNSSGLYKYGDTTDDLNPITAYIETAGLTFGTSNLKSVPSVYLGYSSDGTSILRVRLDGKGAFHYKLNKYSNNLETKKIDIGKGLIGRYFQFEIITDADNFNLESFDFYPMILQRKL